MQKVTYERLTEVLHYDSVTGIFTWKKAPGPRSTIGTRAGSKKSGGYRHIGIDGKRYDEHQLAWFYTHKTWPIYEIDHIDTITDHNWILNLQDIPHKYNTQRINHPRKSNKCKCTGVHQQTKNRYRAQIMVNGLKIYLGSFTTMKLASAAYQAAKLTHHFQ